ncbi:MAG: D-2-hydroxyacid dehydrogenase [Deinococcota bacterium]
MVPSLFHAIVVCNSSMNAHHNVTVLVANYFSDDDLKPLQRDFPSVTFERLTHNFTTSSESLNFPHADALLRAAMTKEDLAHVLHHAPDIRWIHTSTAGFDWLMIPEVVDGIREGHLQVTRSAATYSKAIGEFVIGAMFLLAKRFPRLLNAQSKHEWIATEPLELANMTLGIVGTGAIGQEVAWRAQALGLQVIGMRRTPAAKRGAEGSAVEGFDEVFTPDRLHQLLQASDIVVLAAPLTSETKHMIDASALRAMRSHAYLINVGRGALVAMDALKRALGEAWIAGALFDVFETEPLPENDAMWDVPNLVVTPHTSFRSPHNAERILEEFSANLSRFIADEPLLNTMRNPTLGY